MKNIRIIKTGINVSKILKQLKEYPEDWNFQQNIPETQSLNPDEYIVEAAVLQLTMGVTTDENEPIFDSDAIVATPAYHHHTATVNFLKRYFKGFRRAGFLCLPPGGKTGAHVDFGKYCANKDRYHLSIQGMYEYVVGDEKIIVEPGTLFWFNNKIEHSALNIGDIDRISLVFDVPHSKNNP